MTIEQFSEERFPIDVSFGSTGGPERRTDIVTLGSGQEQRNQRWARSRRRYEAGYGIKDLDSLHRVLAFYEARRGPLIGFRYRDPLDWKSCSPLQEISYDDQEIGIGDGVQTTFPISKSYGEGSSKYTRLIEKPVLASVVVAVDGNPIAPSQYEVEGGEIEFQPTSIPAAGSVVSAGYEFDVPVRFASDQLTISLSAFAAGDVPTIPLMEIVL